MSQLGPAHAPGLASVTMSLLLNRKLNWLTLAVETLPSQLVVLAAAILRSACTKVNGFVFRKNNRLALKPLPPSLNTDARCDILRLPPPTLRLISSDLAEFRIRLSPDHRLPL